MQLFCSINMMAGSMVMNRVFYTKLLKKTLVHGRMHINQIRNKKIILKLFFNFSIKIDNGCYKARLEQLCNLILPLDTIFKLIQPRIIFIDNINTTKNDDDDISSLKHLTQLIIFFYVFNYFCTTIQSQT